MSGEMKGRWATGETFWPLDHREPLLVYTGGRKKWSKCDGCGTVWNAGTGEVVGGGESAAGCPFFRGKNDKETPAIYPTEKA
jgi:hypothetical protein